MKTYKHLSGVIAGALAITASAFGFQTRIGDPAPQFSVTSMGGKQMFFKDMQTGGPVFIYFIRDGDSVSQQETYYIDQIIKGYGTSRATWYGIINARQDRASSFQAEVNPAFQLERDENTSAAKAFMLTNAPAVFEYSRKGKLLNVWKGYSSSNLKAINAAMGKAGRMTPVSIDFSKAPDSVQYGVDYNGTTKSSG